MSTLTSPIAKLYKRCARNHHDTCPGSFETWSVCSCDCHAGVSDDRAAPTMPRPAVESPVTCADKHDAVLEAVAIVTPKPAKKSKASGLSTKTDKYAKWANAIVAKNARIRVAAEESLARRGLKPAVLGMAVNRILTPRCEHCHQYMQVRWVDDHNFDSDVVVAPCGCQEKGG